MNTKVKLIVAALSAAGVIAPLPALADTITPLVTTLTPQSPVVGNTYVVSYPVIVTLAGGTPQALTFSYNADGSWTTPAGWSYDASLNPNANTAVFTTTSGTTEYGIAISSTGTTQFTPGIGAPSTTVPPSVGVVNLNRPVAGSALGWAGATATGTVNGVGITTAPLAGAPAVVQIIGVGAGGAPVGVATIGAPVSTPTTGTSGPGSAGGSVAVNSNLPNQSIGWGEYTATFPTTPTPSGTASVSGTIAGSSGSVGADGIFLNNITGTASYNTTTGVISATPVETSTFSVMPNGDTHIGGTLHVAGQTMTNGLANTGNMTNSGSLTTGSLTVNGPAVVNGTLRAGATSTAGLTNTGAMSTTTLTVTGATVTNGISNFGALSSTGNATIGGNAAVAGNATVGGTLGVTGNTTIAGSLTSNGITNTGNVATTTLGVTGNATIGGTLAVAGQSNTHGINNTGNLANSGNATIGGTLGVTGASTLNGATTVNNTLTATGTTTLGSTSGTGGNTVVVNSGGVSATAGSSSLSLTSTRAGLSGGGASMVLANNTATFSAPAVSGTTGGPIRVTGIADGSSQYDAVNYGQFDEARKDAARGIAAAGAALNIPQLDQNKAFNLGVGVGGYDGEVAWAIGGSARISKDGIIRASVAAAGGGGSKAVWGVGGGWSW